jgi:hypothetical protein
MGNHGFLLSHCRLKNHVDEICRAHLGSEFPEGSVGVNWTHCFVEKHSEQLKISRSRPLESKRGQAVNQSTNEAWWSLLSETVKKFDIKQHNTYGVDEMGCQPAGGEREYVIGAWKTGPQYQQRSGSRENITNIVTICTDGTATSPAVIFKGSGYYVKWKQDNPSNAS